MYYEGQLAKAEYAQSMKAASGSPNKSWHFCIMWYIFYKSNDVIKIANKVPKAEGYESPQNETIVYVVEVVAKCFVDLKIVKEDCISTPTKTCDNCEECDWPEHEGKCDPKSLQN